MTRPTAAPSALTPTQERYCQLRASGETIGAATRKIGVSHDTATRWNKLPAIQQRIDALQLAVTADAMRYLKAHAMTAAMRVVELTRDGTATAAAVNLAACRDLLDRVGLKPTERQELTISSADLDAAARRLAEETGVSKERALEDLRARLRLVS